MTNLARIYLVRHGETDANRQRIIQGQLDNPLNSIGIQQALLLARALQAIPFDLAFTSDLRRAYDTATAIVHYQPGLDLRKDIELRERFMGELEGQVYATYKLPGVESTMEAGPAFAARTLSWWRNMIAAHITPLPEQENSYNVLVVSHGGFINTMVRELIKSQALVSDGGPTPRLLPNSSVSLIEWDGKAWNLVRYGDVEHLSTGPLDYNADEIRI